MLTKDKRKSSEPAYAQGIKFYHIFWLFLIASVLGFIIESLYGYIQDGYFESRQGMLYGPISQIYGIGAVLMVIVLSRLEKFGNLFIFIVTALIGTIFEVFCSFAQELIFGTTSWRYAYNIESITQGRTGFKFTIFWGLLGLVLIRWIYPALFRFLEKMKSRTFLMVTWVLFALIMLDALLSTAAVYRWVQRSRGYEPANVITEFIDDQYPDNVMKKIYPNMLILDD